MPTVVIKPLVKQKINSLYFALLEDDYFSEEQNAPAYCDDIEAYILSIPVQKHFKKNQQHGGILRYFQS